MRIHSSGHGDCSYKRKYRRKMAKAISIAVSKRLNEEMQAYKCGRCHAWHIGHVERYRTREQRAVAAFQERSS